MKIFFRSLPIRRHAVAGGDGESIVQLQKRGDERGVGFTSPAMQRGAATVYSTVPEFGLNVAAERGRMALVHVGAQRTDGCQAQHSCDGSQ